MRVFSPRFALALLFLAPAFAAAQVPEPGVGSVQRPPQEAIRTTHPLPVFEFHSGFWVNLHHVLYQQARLEAARPTTRSQPLPPAGTEKLFSLEKLSAAEQSAWTSAVADYAKRWSSHDLLFDTEMARIKDQLEEMGDTESLQTSGLKADLVAALERAAPVYRAHWWMEDDRANREWIFGVAPMVEQLGAHLARELARVYRVPWPAGNIRVDVCSYAGLFGGYTTLDPLRVTVSSRDPRNQGDEALEVLFHESSHALAQPVRDAIIRDCRASNKAIPRDLWHALLFYTTGEVVRRSLTTKAGQPASYEPYGYRHGLYVRDWQSYERALEQFWRPYIEGRDNFDDAVAQLVNQL